MPRQARASGQSEQTLVVDRANELEEYSCRERMQVSAACLFPRVAILSCFYFFLFLWRDASAHLLIILFIGLRQSLYLNESRCILVRTNIKKY